MHSFQLYDYKVILIRNEWMLESLILVVYQQLIYKTYIQNMVSLAVLIAEFNAFIQTDRQKHRQTASTDWLLYLFALM